MAQQSRAEAATEDPVTAFTRPVQRSSLVVTVSKTTVVQRHWCGMEGELHHRDRYISVVSEVTPARSVKHSGVLTDDRCYISVRYCYTPLRRTVSIYSSGFTVEHLEIIVIAGNSSKNSTLNAADCSAFCLSVTGGRTLLSRRNFLTIQLWRTGCFSYYMVKVQLPELFTWLHRSQPSITEKIQLKGKSFHDNIQTGTVPQLPTVQ